MGKKENLKTSEELIKEVITNEEVILIEPETEEVITDEGIEPEVRPTIHMSPEEIESRYQAFLEKIKHGGE